MDYRLRDLERAALADPTDDSAWARWRYALARARRPDTQALRLEEARGLARRLLVLRRRVARLEPHQRDARHDFLREWVRCVEAATLMRLMVVVRGLPAADVESAGSYELVERLLIAVQFRLARYQDRRVARGIVPAPPPNVPGHVRDARSDEQREALQRALQGFPAVSSLDCPHEAPDGRSAIVREGDRRVCARCGDRSFPLDHEDLELEEAIAQAVEARPDRSRCETGRHLWMGWEVVARHGHHVDLARTCERCRSGEALTVDIRRACHDVPGGCPYGPWREAVEPATGDRVRDCLGPCGEQQVEHLRHAWDPQPAHNLHGGRHACMGRYCTSTAERPDAPTEFCRHCGGMSFEPSTGSAAFETCRSCHAVRARPRATGGQS